MKQMKTLTVNGVTYAVYDPTAPRIDDGVVGDAPWSAKKIVDTLCPAFEASGAVVTCRPVAGYPLEVAAADRVTRCGKNLLDLSAAKVGQMNWVTSSGTISADYWGVELILPPGTYTIKATALDTTGGDYIYEQVNDLEKTQHLGSLISVAGSPRAAQTVTFDRWVRLYVYHALAPIAGGETKASAMAAFDRYNIQLEVGSTATDYAPYSGETFAPGEAVPALAGINTIFADTGEITVTGRGYPWQ